MLRLLSITASLMLAFTIMNCDFNTNTPQEHQGEELTWDMFLSMVYEEPGTGVYIVNGDEPIIGMKNLREFYDRHFNPSLFHKIKRLIVHQSGGYDVVWSATQKQNITYCINQSKFGDRYNTVVSAMNTAAERWENSAKINFVHDSSQDSNCTSSNNNVIFDVNPVNASYIARAFFPNDPRSKRNVLIDSSAYNGSYALVDVLTHELGHVIGLRHEHTRPESGRCYEDKNWRALTSYDSRSVMHYPHCGGDGNLTMTSKDREGVAALYGHPDDEPPPAVEGDPIKKTYDSRSIDKGQSEQFGAYAVVAGSEFKASISGNGDSDLYVKFGSQPTTDSYNCRPYTSSSDENCVLEVPYGASKAYIMVSGYSESTYQLSLDYLRPKGVSDASDDGDPQNCHEECHEVQNGCNTETVCETVCE